jgi:hypothetical protein
MPEIETNNRDEDEFGETMSRLNDEQLREVLKKKSLYQKEAVKIAVQEAISRKIIRSEEDLSGPRFRPEPLKSGLFPGINSSETGSKIRKSIGRSLLIAGLVPVIWGVVQINAGEIPEGLMVLLFGVTWMSLSFWMTRQYASAAVISLIMLAGVALIYILKLLSANPSSGFLDWFIVSALFLLVGYGLAFAYRLKS